MFDYKFDDNDYLLNYKAHLVVYEDLVPSNGKCTYSDTLVAQTAHIIFALMVYFDLDACHFDGVNVFLNSYFDEDEIIYCHFSKGFR